MKNLFLILLLLVIISCNKNDDVTPKDVCEPYDGMTLITTPFDFHGEDTMFNGTPITWKPVCGAERYELYIGAKIGQPGSWQYINVEVQEPYYNKYNVVQSMVFAFFYIARRDNSQPAWSDTTYIYLK